MGLAVAALASAAAGVQIAALFDRPDAAAARAVAGGILTDRDHALQTCDVIVDFTSGSALGRAGRPGAPGAAARPW